MSKSDLAQRVELRPPASPAEWAAYYALRHTVLRAPWGQSPASAHLPDDADPSTLHVAAFVPEAGLIGCGRAHWLAAGTAQVRLMAVAPDWEGQGVGRAILQWLEAEAARRGARRMVLEAREAAVAFYRRCGYAAMGPGHVLFGSIRHVRMERNLAGA